MSIKFNPKLYLGKSRIYKPVAGAQNVLRLFVWNDDRNEYQTPERGKCYEARRWEQIPNGKMVRKKRSFNRLEEARAWQRGDTVSRQDSAEPVDESIRLGRFVVTTFANLVEAWKNHHFPAIQPGTQRQYEKLLRLHFNALFELPILSITPVVIDEWIGKLKEVGSDRHRKTRKSFEHELNLLSTILRFCVEYDDEGIFRFPVKERHRKAIALNRKLKPRLKQITEHEFWRFLDCLTHDRLATVLVPLAVTQYYQALRISEAAALHWEDVVLNFASPSSSFVRVSKKIEWPRKQGQSSYVTDGFKNSDANEGSKELPMFPAVFRALTQLQTNSAPGLIFQVDGRHLEYHTIKNAYDRAFKRAGLPHRATHIMRHGGCQRQFEKRGDLELAKQLLGNADMQSVQVYAQRSKNALVQAVREEWEKEREVVAIGRKDEKTA